MHTLFHLSNIFCPLIIKRNEHKQKQSTFSQFSDVKARIYAQTATVRQMYFLTFRFFKMSSSMSSTVTDGSHFYYIKVKMNIDDAKKT